MNGRRHSGLMACLLAGGLMACTGSPIDVGNGPDGRPLGPQGTPALPSPSPFTELEAPGQADELVADPVPNLNWALREIGSPLDQQIQRIHGAPTTSGEYKLFLQQGDRFYFRTPAQSAQSSAQSAQPPTWYESQKLPSHRDYAPTRLFSDGNWLFFVNDPDEVSTSGQERIYQAREGSPAWVQCNVPPGIVAVAGGAGIAFAATLYKLYRFDPGADAGSPGTWTMIAEIPGLNPAEKFIGLTYDGDASSKDLIVLLQTTTGSTFRLMVMPEGGTSFAAMRDDHLTFSLLPAEEPLKAYRSYQDPNLGGYRYWAFTKMGRILYGTTAGSMVPYQAFPDINRKFVGLLNPSHGFLAYRWDKQYGPEFYHLRDENVSSTWTAIASRKADQASSALSVTLGAKDSIATDGSRLYAAGPEGLYRLPLPLNGEPDTYPDGQGGWVPESVGLNRATVERVVLCGSKLFAKTEFGTYVQEGGQWVPFELGGRPAMLFSSIYGNAATVVTPTGVEVHLYLDGLWKKVIKPLPSGAAAKATKVFFSKDRLYVAAEVQNGEAVYQRALEETRDWSLAAPDQGISSLYPNYISDGRTLLAVGTERVRLASVTEQQWKDYPATQVLPDGSTQPMHGVFFEVPFAVYGYAFVWIHMGGSEYRLCRATAKGWKPVVSDQFEGVKVAHLLSTDGHYLYSSTSGTVSTAHTRKIVRVPIKGGSAWEEVPTTLNGQSLELAGLRVNGPPFIDRTYAKVYLPTSRGLLGP